MKRGNVIISEGMQKFYPGQKTTQQDYYGRRCGTLLHRYCIGTYTEVTVLLL